MRPDTHALSNRATTPPCSTLAAPLHMPLTVCNPPDDRPSLIQECREHRPPYVTAHIHRSDEEASDLCACDSSKDKAEQAQSERLHAQPPTPLP